MKRLALILCLCLTLTGCSWFQGSYVSVTPHRENKQDTQSGSLSAEDYPQLLSALREMVAKTTESAPIIVANYRFGNVKRGMAAAAETIRTVDPIGAYAVESITYELGTNGGLSALAVNITYRHTLAEIQGIHHVKTMDQAAELVEKALENYATGIVLYVENYRQRDFSQLVQDYGTDHPDGVMEIPQVTEILYGTGGARVVELVFSYQNSRDVLRQMRQQVQPVFEAAELYVSGTVPDRQKYAQLYGFLMERFDYKVETSITPAYSLLCYGVGDSRAFATVYAAMCRKAGLPCQVVTGTRAGEPHTWNLVRDGEQYYHVDLLRSHDQGQYRQMRDWEMDGYVWDYSAYPGTRGIETPLEPPEETAAK